MKEDRVLQERIKLLEKEILTLTTEISNLKERLKGYEDLEDELRGIKIYLGRIHPDFKKQLPEIVKKLKTKKP